MHLRKGFLSLSHAENNVIKYLKLLYTIERFMSCRLHCERWFARSLWTKPFIWACSHIFVVMRYDCLKCRIKLRITDKIWNKIKKQTHYLTALRCKFNLTSSVIFNLHWHVLKTGFKKSHPCLQHPCHLVVNYVHC